jgi:hypothetical protein
VHRRCGCVEDFELAVSVARRWVGKAKRKRVRCTVREGLRCGWDSNALSSWTSYVEEGEERGW